ncbi:hypothetical protein [Mesorhizobium norvegicum]|uniref:hypothetical protein n=1 Tax=Mesorhizobium norvegicum TaxID=1085774 RepID=UPI001AEF0692|nr:hypothetical protein [Mesorhizobium norvegicum]
MTVSVGPELPDGPPAALTGGAMQVVPAGAPPATAQLSGFAGSVCVAGVSGVIVQSAALPVLQV